jgi:lysophospholipase L1-like esterase
MRFLSNITILIAALAAAAACGGKGPIQPPPPPPEEIQIACPGAIAREATSPQGTDVHFDAPVPTGGTAPYNVQCEPGSSSIFPVGETIVRCTATSAMMAQASCSFAVTVRVSQTITKTRFTAFGDSITEGTISLAPVMMLDAPEAYPFKLEQMLLQRYPTQPIVVINRGQGGERTDRALDRLRAVLEEDKPQVMLLLEGINAINSLSTSAQTSALRDMITEAQRRGVDVIIATVMPILPTSHLYQPGNTTAKIQALNAQIFALAAQYKLGPPVDLFAIFNADQRLIGPDGLHPTAEGQTRIAEAFRDEIVRRYDAKSTTSLGFSTMLRTR